MNAEHTKTLATAGQFDVHKWSDYPQIKAVTEALFELVVAHRKSRNPKSRIVKPEELRKHLRVLLIDLYVANQSANPWRGISRRKPDYQEESRYRKVYLTFDLLTPLIDDLVEMGYVEQVRGFKDRTTNKGYRTRVKASSSLIEFIEADKYRVKTLTKAVGITGIVIDNPEAERETIVLRDADKRPLDYEDTPATNWMRDNLRIINARLTSAEISLRISDDQWGELNARLLNQDEDRESIDFTRKTLHRVFNVDFEHGGRFYGGWWIGLPSEFRKYIEIGRKHTVEVDFSAHHIRILYAKAGKKPPLDPYQSEDCPYSRDVLKQVFLILINASGRESTIKACSQKGIKDAETILEFLVKHHQPISDYFHSGMGLVLQREDSELAEEVMLRMGDRGAVVLPVHDSFIVRASFEDELYEVMEEVFSKRYGIPPAMKAKRTVLDSKKVQVGEDDLTVSKPVNPDLSELIKDLEKYSISRKIFGEKCI